MPLLSIPTELLAIVINYLPLSSIITIRQTCRLVESCSFQIFSSYFHTKSFMLTYRALKAIREISYSRLNKSIHTLYIGTETLDRSQFDIPKGYSEHLSQLLYKKPYLLWKRDFKKALDDQEYISRNGIDIEILADAFSRLTNLSAVGIQLPSYEDNISSCHLSWGAARLCTDLGGSRGDLLTWDIKRSFAVLTTALATSDIHVKEIRVIPFNYERYNQGVDISTFRLPHTQLRMLHSSFQRLRILHLTIDVSFAHLEAAESLDLGIPQFLLTVTNLVELHLGFSSFLPNRSTIPLFQEIAQTLFIPSLDRLELRNAVIQGSHLESILVKHRGSLQDVKLQRVQLIEHYWVKLQPVFCKLSARVVLEEVFEENEGFVRYA